MTYNNKVQLSGYLGQDPKLITKSNKSFTVLSVATTDSYPVKKEGQTIWKDKETEWHDVFVFRPAASKFANELRKGDKVEISGSISYQLFKDQEGKNRRQATIIASFIEQPDNPRIDQCVTKELVKDLAISLAA